MDINTLISMGIGAIITWYVSKYFYQQAGNDLKEEAEKLKRLNVLILRSLEKAGYAKFSRDANGNIVGLIIELSSKITSKSHSSDAKADIV